MHPCHSLTDWVICQTLYFQTRKKKWKCKFCHHLQHTLMFFQKPVWVSSMEDKSKIELNVDSVLSVMKEIGAVELQNWQITQINITNVLGIKITFFGAWYPQSTFSGIEGCRDDRPNPERSCIFFYFLYQKRYKSCHWSCIPFQKVHFCTQRLHIGTLVVHIST